MLVSSLLSLRFHRLPLPRLFAVISFGIPGAALGALGTLLIPPLAARRGLGLLLVIAGMLTLRSTLRRRMAEREKKRAHTS